MTNPIHFYDSASPSHIPNGAYAGVYVNGFAWPESEIQRMSHVFRISVEREAHWASKARCIDVESGAAQPEDVVPFLHERFGLGHHDGTAYVNRSNWDDVHERVRRERESKSLRHFYCRFWVATLDGNQTPSGPTVTWAVQYLGGMNASYDVSVLHGVNDFVKP